MNPRRFCREPSYPKALLLTYSFDPVFFERLVLPDLRAGNASDILVIGDRQQIDVAITAAAGQIWDLGKRYLLAGANHAGSFHPKVVLRLGTQNGAILLGSGNLTSAGWGGNQELGTAWMFGPKYADKGAWLHAFLDQVMAWCSGELERDAVRRMKEVPWLSRTPVNAAGSNPVLHSQPGQALGPALAQRWRGRRFDEVKILTGSTDESGAFLRWAHATFGIQRAIVALTPARTSFLPEKLKDLPVDLRLIAAPADRPLHAKLYWFDGPMGPGAVMGSANCSAAAWRLPPNRGGNVETVVVYDAPNAEEFESALALFSAPSQAPADLLSSSPSIRTYQPPPIQREYELISLSWDLTTCCVRAGLRPPPPDDSTVELILDGQRLPMRHPRSPGGCWECELPEGIGSATVFASVRLYRGTQIWDTQLRWVDDLAALQQASQSARLLAPFEGLERSDSSAEQNQVLNELQEIAQVLFADAASFRDPAFGLGRQEPTAHETPPAPVNPNDLVCHLEESPDTLPQVGSSRPGTLPLTGILRLLFDAEPDEGGGTATELIEDLDEEQGLASGGKALAKRKSEKETTHQDLTPIEERLRKRLADQIETFLGNLSSRQFARQCTATQMVQAVAFPLAIAVRGQRRGWVSAELAEKWALAVFSILFRDREDLLHTVERRYLENNQIATFNEVVGDGTLWMVLVATLGNARWPGVGTAIDKAVALRKVFAAPQLVASAHPTRITGLLGKINIDSARSYLAEIAPGVVRLLDQIEDTLGRFDWEAEIRSQAGRAITHRAGDWLWLWREKIWAVCLVETGANTFQPVEVRLRGVEKRIDARFFVNYYANVTQLANRFSELAGWIEALQSCLVAPQQTD